MPGPSANFALGAGRAVAEALANGDSPLQADIPTEVGGSVDLLWDTAYEQPSGAEDSVDTPGWSAGEATDATGVTDSLDPTSGDDTGWSSPSVIRAVFGGALVLAVIVAVGQLFTINVGDSTS